MRFRCVRSSERVYTSGRKGSLGHNPSLVSQQGYCYHALMSENRFHDLWSFLIAALCWFYNILIADSMLNRVAHITCLQMIPCLPMADTHTQHLRAGERHADRMAPSVAFWSVGLAPTQPQHPTMSVSSDFCSRRACVTVLYIQSPVHTD